jgi:hypothetical protein
MDSPQKPEHFPQFDHQALRSWELDHAEMIKLLCDAEFRELIRFFMHQPNTIRAAATHFGLSVQRIYNRVARLEQVGFLEVVDKKVRAGKPQKFYQTSADDYFVPFAATEHAGYAEMLQDELQPLNQQLYRSLEQHLKDQDPNEWGMRLFKDPNGQTHLAFTPRHDWQNFSCLETILTDQAPALVNFWGVVHLSQTQAKALQRELTAVWAKHYFAALAAPDPHGEQHIVGLSLAPRLAKS